MGLVLHCRSGAFTSVPAALLNIPVVLCFVLFSGELSNDSFK